MNHCGRHGCDDFVLQVAVLQDAPFECMLARRGLRQEPSDEEAFWKLGVYNKVYRSRRRGNVFIRKLRICSQIQRKRPFFVIDIFNHHRSLGDCLTKKN